MADNLIFNDIPVDIRTPGSYVEIDSSRALRGLPQERRRLLLVADFTDRAALVRQLFEVNNLLGVSQIAPVRILSTDQAKTRFGLGVLAEMVDVALRNNQTSELFALPIALAGSSGAATLDAVAVMAPIPTGITFVTGGSISIAVGPTPIATLGLTSADVAVTQNTEWYRTKIGPKLMAALHKNANSSWVAAKANPAANSGTDWLQLLHKTAISTGTAGTSPTITLKVSPSATPISLTIGAAAVASVAWPAWEDIEAVLAGHQWHSIALGGAVGNLQASTANAMAGDNSFVDGQIPWAEDRYGPLVAEPCHVFGYSQEATASELIDVASSYNSVHLTALALPASAEAPHKWVAALAAVCDFQAAIDPARPLQTLILNGVSAPPEADRYSRYIRDQLLHNKLTTWTVDAGGNVRLERVITTYTTNSEGFNDPSLLDLETKFTVDYVRFAVRSRIASKFPRMKLADDGTRFASGQPIVTPKVIRAELIALFRELELVGLVEGFDQFAADLQVVRSSTDPNRVNAIIPPDIVNQFRVFAAAVQFRL